MEKPGDERIGIGVCSQPLTKPYGWTMMSGWQRYQLVFVGLSLCSPWAHVLYYFTFGYSLKPKYK